MLPLVRRRLELVGSANRSLLPSGSDSEETLATLEWLAKKALLRQDAMLLGESVGTLRSLAFRFCEVTGREAEHVSISRDTTESDLKQRREIRGGSVVYSDLPVVQAAVNGRVRCHDDFLVLVIGLPVPRFPGAPLDPPLRSRFQSIARLSAAFPAAPLPQLLPRALPPHPKVSEMLRHFELALPGDEALSAPAGGYQVSTLRPAELLPEGSDNDPARTALVEWRHSGGGDVTSVVGCGEHFGSADAAALAGPILDTS
ncbi:hypothetical protein EMIHUDRAFT_201397 [Emiliania huxleyi CCMP1516]|uniref:ATPase dynein-related AAA domain-containing protein n=2 Tax=Emiliania huxleyi TaxID=2903 RepID=A0A0D3KHX1_EMIH1|nr:hypothetical protein EMIHUDRAFT_201397 [Emiliania huxleyi CCMP1516]EOD35356.1 hypothetical protein EMIHUDRAFT_201397 [Emiliania huxleyi CCMP1516]|eukprot:XP_005787785.1 hypothetical protein EMIHUDRAFT_201397 [Emiliania huxleyi CCMP1516]